MADPEKAPVHTDSEDEDMGDEAKTKQGENLASQLMKNPEVLAALQSKLGSVIGTPSGYIQSLPKVVKRRIKAMKKLQFEWTGQEAKFFEEVHALECKYSQMYAPIYEKRKGIATGKVEPTDEECDFPSDDEEEELSSPLQEDIKEKVKIEDIKEEDETEKEEPSGIPEFWLTIFKNVEMISEMIQDHDEPILKLLTDVTVTFTEKDPMGFKLDFHFSENEFFTNSVLTKTYEMKCSPDESDPFAFEGPEIVKCTGSKIEWNKGKDVTIRTIKKKQKHKSKGATRTVVKTVKNDSFFNFFNPPAIPENDDASEDEEAQAILSADFEIGHFIRDRIVPRAVLYFTGEALQDDDDYEEEEDEECEDDTAKEDDDEDDPDYTQSNKNPPPDCKQQ
ncbi:Nucleosome assembly protein 1-like 1 [Nymphon striatum]|nr:Nucleosome assembly protein 1-like 1 [Nymphon striatum]